MTFVFMLVGALGASLVATVFDGADMSAVMTGLFGGAVGLLLAQTRDLRARLARLEGSGRAGAAPVAARAAAPSTSVDQRTPAPAATGAGRASGIGLEALPVPAATSMAAPMAAPMAAATADMPSPPRESALAASRAPAAAGREVRVAQPSAAQDAAGRPASATAARPASTPVDPVEAAVGRLAARVKAFATQGNVPVKVGVLVLFLGVAALLKYAADQGWLRMPIQFRLAGVAVAAMAALAFAWRKRDSHRSFALSLQGGAIGVLLLSVFAAFRLYDLLPAGLAFALLVVIVAGGAVLAVLQDAIALAVLAIAGGFLAPILTSTGQGDHVALFAYYAVLNAAILGIAWNRPWRVLNLLGFAFTFGIGIAWGVTSYRADHFATTEPFLVLFFAFYLLLPVLHARRRVPAGGATDRAYVDGTLTFGTPLVAFGLQAGLLDGARLPLAFSALATAGVYAVLATLELRRWKLDLLGRSHAILALGFATLAVPLALSAQATSCTWALEGAALVWLGLRQARPLTRRIGYGLQLAAAASFASALNERSPLDVVATMAWDAGHVGVFVSALLIAAAGLVTARLLSLVDAGIDATDATVATTTAPGATATPAATRATPREVGHGFFVWGWLWLWLAFSIEIQRVVPDTLRADLALTLFAATALVAGEALRRWQWKDCAWPVFAMFPLGVAVLAMTTGAPGIADRGPLEQASAAGWAFWIACALRSLGALRSPPWCRAAHAIFLWVLALLVSVEAAHLLGDHLQLGFVWQAFGGLLPAAAMFALVLRRDPRVRWPLADASEPSRSGLLASFAAVIGLGCLCGLFAAGDPAPLPYVPLLNPLELGQLVFLLLLLSWFGRAAREGRAVVDAESRARALSAAAFAILTAVTLRSVHFLGGVSWDASLWESPLAQAALSIVWTLAGIVAMLVGQRRGSRAVWFGGAVLMAIVVAKLGLVDRRFLHDLQSIVGVLVVGLLLVAVGYFAPVPPRATPRAAEA